MMCKIQIKHFLAGLFLTLALGAQGFAQSSESRPSDTGESATPKSQASYLLDLEILSKAEQRAESLRSKLFDLQMQENALQTRLDDLDYRLMPDNIQSAIVFVSSTRTMDELRETLRRRLENEKARANKLLELLISNREHLESAISKADAEVERLRQQLESPF